MILPPPPPPRSIPVRQIDLGDDHTRIALVQCLPLAQGVLGLLQHVLQPAFLANLFDDYRGRSYQKRLDFAALVQVVGAAITRHGTVHRALHQAQADGLVDVSERAFYGKLSRVPLPLSLGLLQETTRRLQDLQPAVADTAVPDALAGLQVLLVDGKKSKNVAKRLAATRQRAGRVFGAKLLVCLDARTRLIVAAAASADGESNDNPLVPDLLERVRPQGGLPQLFVCDAQFCDLIGIQRMVGAKALFAFRYHPKTHFHADPDHPARTVVDGKGRTLVEETGWLGSPKDPRRCRVRRVTWRRNTATHKDLSVVTNLSDAAAYPASALIDLYLVRWKIETVFQEVATVFGLRHLIGSTPEASGFETVVCMLVYNILQVVKAELAQQQHLPVDDVSAHNLFRDLREELGALYRLLTPMQIVASSDAPTAPAAVLPWLRQLLHDCWRKGWRKQRNKNPRSYGPKAKQSGAHTSIERLRQRHKSEPPKRS